ncbi:beta-lactamase family protein [Nocardia farcinica]|uniref:serine hydrolase n=1 Tax=Nocardia farcinica TaxID=37329 RepID=UPI0018943BF6|nr:serine hydrolase domain-containing protein [Nocardia farcinica]MBF6234796.1 beta-lactamase family protein [Nocardia farcinica]MBF6445206.1 beta-lactamase family protein [Nocardia farcinica]
MTVTPVYSIAKIFAAAAVLRCLDPEREIGAVAPVPARLAGLRVGDLLTHRSGLGDYGAWPEYRRAVAERGDAWSEQVILERVELARPGVFRYSNPGYLLVRRALEEQHGDRFFPVLRRLVLDPLELPAHPFASRADWAHCTVEIPAGVRAYDPRWVYPAPSAPMSPIRRRRWRGCCRARSAPSSRPPCAAPTRSTRPVTRCPTRDTARA